MSKKEARTIQVPLPFQLSKKVMERFRSLNRPANIGSSDNIIDCGIDIPRKARKNACNPELAPIVTDVKRPLCEK